MKSSFIEEIVKKQKEAQPDPVENTREYKVAYAFGIVIGISILVSMEALFLGFVLTLFGLSFSFSQGLALALILEYLSFRIRS